MIPRGRKVSHCSYKALNATEASRNQTGLRRNMAAMLMYFVKINDLVWLNVEKVHEDLKMIGQTKNKIVVVVKKRPSKSREGGRDSNNLLNKHTHTALTGRVRLLCLIAMLLGTSVLSSPPDGEKSEALCHIHLSSIVCVRVRKMDKQAAGLDKTVMNTHRLCWGSVFKCASPPSPHNTAQIIPTSPAESTKHRTDQQI